MPKISHISGRPPFLALLALAIALCASPAIAGMRLEAPKKAARGDAFVARAIADEPVEKFMFFWRGRNIPVKARMGDSGSEALVLLPVPLDEKAGQLNLSAGALKEGQSRAIASVSAAIALYDRKRPVQKLSVDKKYVNPPAAEMERIKADRQKVKEALSQTLPERLWELPLQRPVPGSVSSLFGMKRIFNGQERGSHKGLDLRGASGTPIKACADGEVVLVDNLYYSGNTVYLNHGDGVFSAYLHMSEPKVRLGQRVSRDDVIGLVGATGRVTGPHLHLSLIAQGQLVDPQPLLEKPAPQGKKPAPAGGAK